VVSDVESSPGIWARKDYTSIFPGLLSDLLARKALSNRDRILERTRSILRANYPALRQWLEQRSELFRFTPPRAGAIAFARYRLPLGSTELVARLREEESVLLVAGDHFGVDGFVRIGFGNEPSDLKEALVRMDAFLRRLG
jgi:aspartate/methionine/tyrosine aminotransferase